MFRRRSSPHRSGPGQKTRFLSLPIWWWPPMAKTRFDDADRYVLRQAEVAEVLPSGWFYDRLAERLARRANDVGLVASIHEQAAVRVDRQFVRLHRLTLVELGAMAVGTLMCVLLWFRRNEPSSLLGCMNQECRRHGRAGSARRC